MHSPTAASLGPPLQLIFEGADVLRPCGVDQAPLAIAKGLIAAPPAGGRRIDLRGYRILPGIVDIHGDGFERHVAPRRGAAKNIAEGLRAAEAELAVNGITTAVLAQFLSWEGGLRSPEFGARVLEALAEIRAECVTDLRGQVRLETHLLDLFETLPDDLVRWDVAYVVFNDHLPHERFGTGRPPPRLIGQALKAGRSPEAHLALIERLMGQGDAVALALERLSARLSRQGILLGSHDDNDAAERALWRRRGVQIAEFPETLAAAEAAHAGGDAVIMGAPNILRGGSHKGNVNAIDLVAMGYCDALASDYHYPSLLRAAIFLEKSGLCDLAGAWRLVSEGPARILGLSDRGTLCPGQRADLVVLDAKGRIVATIAGGRLGYMAGDIAARFLT